MDIVASVKNDLVEIAENQQKLFGLGHEAGYREGYAGGEETGYNTGYGLGSYEGRQAEHDKIWGGLQHNGNRKIWEYTFSYFPSEIFYPKYDICPTASSEQLFRYFGRIDNPDGSTSYTDPIDLTERLENCGVTFDLSGSTKVNGMFSYANSITRCPIIDTRNSPSVELVWLGNNAIVTIDKLILKDDGSQSLRRAFESNISLENIEFEGVIGYSEVNFQWSPLTAESAKSVILHLKDFSGTSSAGANSITFSETTLALLEAEGATSPNGNTWLEYIEDLGWIC